jgi:Cof subfamily protein (haloacid dehalogenase superfamily)
MVTVHYTAVLFTLILISDLSCAFAFSFLTTSAISPSFLTILYRSTQVRCRLSEKSLPDEEEHKNDEFNNAKDLPSGIASISNGKMNQPSKTDLYSSDELLNLLSVHTSLSQSIPTFSSSGRVEQIAVDKFNDVPSLHDLIEKTVHDIEIESTGDNSPESQATGSAQQWKGLKFQSSLEISDFESKFPNIRAIASDVDGTLLGSDHAVHPITERAIINAVEASYSPIHPLQYFFLATGKSRSGALNSLGPKLKALLQQCPGVYVQGLYCVDASGSVVFEMKLSRIAIEQAEAFSQQFNVTLVAYDGDSLYVTASSHAQHVEEINSRWGEPHPIMLEGSVTDYKPCFHKILLMGDDPVTMSKDIRPQLEVLAASLGCVVTQAIPTMLELLPGGCSKAVGVQKLCESLGLDLSTQVCAIGDGENDLDMIQMASIGVAVGNAVASVKDVASVVMEGTNDDGSAGQAIELFGLGKLTEQFE